MRGLDDPLELLAAKAAAATLGMICAPVVLWAFLANGDAYNPVPYPFDLIILLLGLLLAAGTVAVLAARRGIPAWNRRVAAPVAGATGAFALVGGVAGAVLLPEGPLIWAMALIYGVVHVRAAIAVWRFA